MRRFFPLTEQSSGLNENYQKLTASRPLTDSNVNYLPELSRKKTDISDNFQTSDQILCRQKTCLRMISVCRLTLI